MKLKHLPPETVKRFLQEQASKPCQNPLRINQWIPRLIPAPTGDREVLIIETKNGKRWNF